MALVNQIILFLNFFNLSLNRIPFIGADADICPAGYYCLEGTAAPIACPEGTYSPNLGLTQESECLNCTGGFFCNDTGVLI